MNTLSIHIDQPLLDTQIVTQIVLASADFESILINMFRRRLEEESIL